MSLSPAKVSRGMAMNYKDPNMLYGQKYTSHDLAGNGLHQTGIAPMMKTFGSGYGKTKLKKMTLIKYAIKKKNLHGGFLTGLLSALAPIVIPEVSKLVEKGVSWLGKKIAGKGISDIPAGVKYKKGTGKKIKRILSMFKKHGPNFLKSIVNKLAGSKKLEELANRGDKIGALSKIISTSSKIAKPSVDKFASVIDQRKRGNIAAVKTLQKLIAPAAPEAVIAAPEAGAGIRRVAVGRPKGAKTTAPRKKK